MATDVRRFVALECEENCRKIVTRQIGAELAGEMEGNRNNPGEKREAAQGAGWWARQLAEGKAVSSCVEPLGSELALWKGHGAA
jgi:hypothetical protein